MTAVAVAAVVVGGGLAACSPSASPVPVAEGFGPGDGLNRFVVTLVDAADPLGDAAAPSPAPTADATSGSMPAPARPGAELAPDVAPEVAPGARGRLDVGLLDRAHTVLGLGGRVIAYGSSPYYVSDGGAMLVGPGGDGSVVDVGSLGADARPRDASGSAGSVHAAGAVGPADSAPVTSEQALATLAARSGVASAQRLTDGTVLVATGLTEAEVAALPEVADVTPSTQVPVLGSVASGPLAGAPAPVPDDPYLPAYGWNLRNTGSNAYGGTAVAGADVDALTAWTVTQGQGTVVAVVDTGFDSDHPDLVGSLWTNPTEACGGVDTNGNGKAGDCHGWNFYANSPDVDNGPLGSHGTSVAGVIGARADNGHGSAGVAPQVQLMPLVVGGGENVDVHLAAEAIRYAADHGADVVNASFGGSFGGPALVSLRSAVDYAIGKGVVVVAAAGNDSANRDAAPVYPASLDNPALLTVASTTATDTLASHSAYGVSSVDLGAPGQNVVTTWNDGSYRIVSGTSTAAPHVAAAAALHRSLTDLTPAEVRTALLADTEPLPALAGRTVSGGRLDVGPLVSAADRIAYTFSGMVGTAGQQRPVVEVTSTAPAGTYAVTFGLAMLVDGEVWAVSGEDVTFAGALATTDDAGTATFSLGVLPGLGTRTLEPALSLGAGSFALTVQVLRDGQALTRPFAAPLVVAPQGAGSGGTDPGTGDGDPPAGGGSEPGSGGGGEPGTGGGTGPGPGIDPGTGGATDPPAGGGTDPGTGGGAAPGDGGGKVPGIGTGGGSPDPDDGGSTPPGGGSTPPGDGSTAPGGTGTDPGPGAGNPGTGGGTQPGGSGPAPSDPDIGWYDRVGAFAVTQISPVHVPAEGGSLVTVRGDALEPGVSVRVGTTAMASVLLSTTDLVVFRTPPRVPGTYDVTISRLGRTSVLVDALVYMAPGESGGSGGSGGSTPPGSGGSTDPGSTGPGSTDPGSTDPGSSGPESSGPGGSGPGSADPGTGGGTTPGGATDPGSGGGTGPGGSDGGGGGGAAPPAPRTTRIGPNGEHLVRSDALAPLVGLWSRQCTTTCAGVQV